MTAPDRHIHLSLFHMPHGHLPSSWRLAEVAPHSTHVLETTLESARLAERGLFDAFFIADRGSAGPEGNWQYGPVGGFEPIGLAGAVAAQTRSLGVVVTASTTYTEPFTLARQLLSLDHLSGGRAGWNIVTSYSPDTLRNYGLTDHVSHDERYDRATESVRVVRELWRSWDGDAVAWDAEEGVWARPASVRAIDHEGEYFRVRGPVDLPRSPQDEPVRVQAGSSPRGIRFAAEHAEVIFTAQTTVELGRAFVDTVHRELARAGRRPSEVLITPGFSFVIGSTDAEAEAEYERLLDTVRLDQVLSGLREVITVDLREYPLDGPVPPLPDPETAQGHKSRLEVYKRIAETPGMTVRKLARRVAGQRGHHQVIGSPERIADSLEHWFASGAADGFNLLPYTQPGQLALFVDHVVPILQERGLYRHEYPGTTLRDSLGLPSVPAPSRSLTPR
ncbi:LLM class flavin-dependent oxidoreductase [Mycetocola reblochoni]|uniref:Nitrilotriacetate monooxygenase component A n=2 Tax=Mycetocola reblochoni TaxID=331618 RepID=A0A1R4IWN6_9MICO|nr:LLM class flavin-dependent oxidoreductase [Mycetocola reblochoni]RLP71003.1 LLM class flavin-dependent oxidoreductase [Mycetocola reblochoni]SJN23743.1 Nitrilotriacetate monooxygenase component A [Mycetocola reblochoni REB411]